MQKDVHGEQTVRNFNTDRTRMGWRGGGVSGSVSVGLGLPSLFKVDFLGP